MVILSVSVVVVGLVACSGPESELVQPDPDSNDFALTNTTHYNPEGLLRGMGLKIYTEVGSDNLEPNSVYNVDVTNDNTDELLSSGQFLTTVDQYIPPYELLFDVGQNSEVEEGDNIRVAVTDDDGLEMEQVISLSVLRLPGWAVEAVDAPEIFVCDELGNSANAYAVGGQDPGEVVGEVLVTGSGFPMALAGHTVDVYVVEDRENWMSELIPQAGEPGHINGPVALNIDSEGNLPITSSGFLPTEADVGTYDLLVDTDGDGEMDWETSVKDSGDGVDEQVGFTVQYSQAWIRARGERHILVNIAYNSRSRDGGQWDNTFNGGDNVYTYLNPPVMHQYHFSVTKYVVAHQDFDTFWNNPENETGPNNCIPFREHVVQHLGVPIQQGCTNTGPVEWGPAAMTLGNEGAFDVVFDRNGDDCYQPGEDLLDVVGGANTSGGLVTFEEFQAINEADQVGFRVIE